MLTSVRERWTRWCAWLRTYVRVRNELLAYTNDELLDLRIGPGDVNGIARAAADDATARGAA